MGEGALRLAARFDPGVHDDFWDRPAAWTSLDLAHPPTLALGQLDQQDAALVNAALPPDLAFLEPAKPFILHASAPERERALLCMTQAVYYEAAFEPLQGQQAVAQIVINRMRHPYFPKSVCGVVYQGSAVPIYCQFSFTCDGSLQRTPVPEYWARAQGVAAAALNGFVANQVGSATFYHADYVFPRWGSQMVKIVQLGAHIFYRFPGPVGDAEALTGRYSGNELAVSITGPSPEAIAAARAALGTGVYASATAPMVAPPVPEPVETISASGPAPVQLVVTPAPLVFAQPGQIVGGRRIPTREEIAQINAHLAPPAPPRPPAAARSPALTHALPPHPASSAPAAADDEGPIATAHSN
jgi:spore germination cell wall hydrolase CwlJ-like protein